MFQAAKNYLQQRVPVQPSFAVVLGSGLGAFADELAGAVSIPYSEIPGWPRATAVGHAGKLVFGALEGVNLAVMAGRSHLYEGYTPSRVTFGVRVLRMLGAQSLVLTNAAGGINLDYGQGALVLISDHINLQGVNALAGANEDDLGPRFPDMSEAYSRRYREIARAAGAEIGCELKEGVYAAMLGPSYETPAEIRFLRTIGADLVGMSTVQEVIAANHMGMKVGALSCVANMAAGISTKPLTHDEVQEMANKAAPQFKRLVTAAIEAVGAMSNNNG
jgi:purine-nucleoside phosphorylase